MLLGAHISISGGVGKALIRGKDIGCRVIQIFTKSSNQWLARPLEISEIKEFNKNKEITGISFVVAHNSYLINIASPDSSLRNRSDSAMFIEMQRAELLGLQYLIIHPGAHTGSGEDAGIKRISDR